eukprot:3778267-Ditylum_brightwellii.AAC.1
MIFFSLVDPDDGEEINSQELEDMQIEVPSAPNVGMSRSEVSKPQYFPANLVRKAKYDGKVTHIDKDGTIHVCFTDGERQEWTANDYKAYASEASIKVADVGFKCVQNMMVMTPTRLSMA